MMEFLVDATVFLIIALVLLSINAGTRGRGRT